MENNNSISSHLLYNDEEDLLIKNELKNEDYSTNFEMPNSFKDILNCNDKINYYLCKNITFLSKKDRKNFHILSRKSEIKFSKKNENHINKLKLLYNLTFGHDSNNILDDNNWKLLGFQTADPSKDFRGGGIEALNSLLYFVKNYNITEIIEFSKLNLFLFAILSINGTYFLKKLFHFGVKSNYIKKIDRPIICNKTGLTNFFNFYNQDNTIFYQLNALYNFEIYHLWRNNVSANNEIEYLHFNKCEALVKNKFRKLFNKEIYSNYTDFYTEFKDTEVNFKININESFVINTNS